MEKKKDILSGLKWWHLVAIGFGYNFICRFLIGTTNAGGGFIGAIVGVLSIVGLIWGAYLGTKLLFKRKTNTILNNDRKN